jgi:hypothetical protein
MALLKISTMFSISQWHSDKFTFITAARNVVGKETESMVRVVVILFISFGTTSVSRENKLEP